MNAREEALVRLFEGAAERFGEPEIKSMKFDTTDRGNSDPGRRVYSMAYDSRVPGLKDMCGPDWTFVHWPGANISSFRKEVEEIKKAGDSTPELNKAGWSGNINSARPSVPEHKTRPLMKSMADENPDIMEVNHVYPPLPRKHKDYMSMADMARAMLGTDNRQAMRRAVEKLTTAGLVSPPRERGWRVVFGVPSATLTFVR